MRCPNPTTSQMGSDVKVLMEITWFMPRPLTWLTRAIDLNHVQFWMRMKTLHSLWLTCLCFTIPTVKKVFSFVNEGFSMFLFVLIATVAPLDTTEKSSLCLLFPTRSYMGEILLNLFFFMLNSPRSPILPCVADDPGLPSFWSSYAQLSLFFLILGNTGLYTLYMWFIHCWP